MMMLHTGKLVGFGLNWIQDHLNCENTKMWLCKTNIVRVMEVAVSEAVMG